MATSKIGIVGAGIMGSGIAQVCAQAGLEVALIDVTPVSLDNGIEAIAASLDRLVKKDKLSLAAKVETLSRITVSLDYASLGETDLVIEAATERLDVKLRILAVIDAAAPDHALIATNTSSISITQLAAVLRRPELFIGMHFFNPVPLMALLELIRGLQTSDETYARSLAFTQAIGKTPVTARNSPGFAVNRILVPMINEAIFALQEGLASAEDIDAGMKLGCNHPIGPLALADMIGLDTLLEVIQVLFEGFGDPKYRPAPLLKEMVAARHLGRKSGRGFFNHS